MAGFEAPGDSYWYYECDRRIRKGEEPTVFEFEGREIPIYARSQTYRSKRRRSELQQAQLEFNRRFWLHCRHDRYLLCDNGTSTIDIEEQRKRGRILPWFDESLVCQHLLGDSVYGLFAQESFDGRQARTYWVAADLDLHLATGGNLALFREQVRVILRHCWGKLGSQIVISRDRANGLHIYFFFRRPKDLERARAALRSALLKIQQAYPDLERRIDEWNDTLKRAGKTWRVRQIGDLEIYPDQNHGFRFIGVRGKDVLADKVIGVVPWGTYARGKRKGQTKHGFDIVSWWDAIQTGERMPQEEVEQIILSRLPTEQPALPEPVARNEADPTPEPCPTTQVEDDPRDVVQPKKVATGGLRRQTRVRLTRYWLGQDNPPGWFEKAVVVTARLLIKEGLSEAETVSLLQRYAREIPENARHCSSRLASGDWASIDQDIAKAVRNIFATNGRQVDTERSDQELATTIAAWSRRGFKISDKTTWGCDAPSAEEPVQIEWSDEDRRDIELRLMPALKIDDPELAITVATEVVRLTIQKQTEGKEWGYAYLKRWLPDRFDIPCGKQAKQAAVFEALVDLKIVEVEKKGRKGRATSWIIGARVRERLGLPNTVECKSDEKEYLRWTLQGCPTDDPWSDLEEEGGEEGKGST